MIYPIAPSVWIAFNIGILILLFVDLVYFHKVPKKVTYKDAFISCGFWLFIAMAFNVAIYYFLGKPVALNFFTGYLIEQSLSIDNLFVFLLLFQYFKIPSEYQYKILFIGVISAIILRACFIFLGVSLLSHFHFIFPIFGLFLIYAGIQMAQPKADEVHPDQNFVLKLLKKVIPFSNEYQKDGRLFIMKDKKRYATPLFAALLCVETTDIIFALDSIPAVMAITLDPFIIYTSNMLAVISLRGLYFALSHTITLFRYINWGLAAILSFVGVKMILADFFEISVIWTLAFIATSLTVAAIASIAFKNKSPPSSPHTP